MIQFLQTVQEFNWSPFQNDELTFPSFFMSDYHDVQNNVEGISLSSQYDSSRLENGGNKTEQCSDSSVDLSLALNIINKQEINESQTELNQNTIFSPASTSHSFEQIRQLILVSMEYSGKSDKILQEQRKLFVGDDQVLGLIFDVLASRFRKLKKTKQEMIKHCMRKAFKFIAEKNDVSIKKTSATRIFFENYFGSEELSNGAIEIPLKKQTSMKTMNRKFLTNVFKSPKFLFDYKQHLAQFQKIAESSNNRKIQFLAVSIIEFINKGTLQKLQTFKRLPWTPIILNKIIQMSHEIMNTSVNKNIDNSQQEKIKRKKGRPKKYQYRCPELYQVKSFDLSSSCTPTMFEQLL